MDTLARFSATFMKGNNLFDFLFATIFKRKELVPFEANSAV